jgi:hypothetical protein
MTTFLTKKATVSAQRQGRLPNTSYRSVAAGKVRHGDEIRRLGNAEQYAAPPAKTCVDADEPAGEQSGYSAIAQRAQSGKAGQDTQKVMRVYPSPRQLSLG